mmetsp:Transcript_5692/g.23658  ORF Transcript_5692/g.23658 Transcript_5692/m.23658 type:complete len:509 (-) Transcript_5692:351-1877(-)
MMMRVPKPITCSSSSEVAEGPPGGVAGRPPHGPRPRPARFTRPQGIDTERRFVREPLFEDEDKDEACEAYFASYREKRVKRGATYMQQCCFFFGLSMAGVFASPQYSHRYYLAWTCGFASFFSMLPSVLPSDNSKIVNMLRLCTANGLIAIAMCTWMFVKKLRQLDRGLLDPAHADYAACEPVAFCAWNVAFWFLMGLFSLTVTVTFVDSALRLAPAPSLNRFWRWMGRYFVAVGLVCLVNTKFTLYAAATNDAYQAPSLWNVAIALEQIAIGAACSSKKFKLWTWSLAASYSGIAERKTTSAVVSVTTTAAASSAGGTSSSLAAPGSSSSSSVPTRRRRAVSTTSAGGEEAKGSGGGHHWGSSGDDEAKSPPAHHQPAPRHRTRPPPFVVLAPTSSSGATWTTTRAACAAHASSFEHRGSAARGSFGLPPGGAPSVTSRSHRVVEAIDSSAPSSPSLVTGKVIAGEGGTAHHRRPSGGGAHRGGGLAPVTPGVQRLVGGPPSPDARA